MASTELDQARNRIKAKIEELRGNIFPVSRFGEYAEKQATIQGLKMALELLESSAPSET